MRVEPRARGHAERARDRADRPRVREPLPVRARGGPARRRGRRGDREHRHRRADADPRRGEEPRATRPWWSRRRATTPSSRSCARASGRLSTRTRQSLALEAFAYTARYDTAISRWFAEREEDFPPQYTRSYEKVLDLPYGENPHQRAAYYAEVGARTHLLSMVSKLHGKELSFNNLLDLDSGAPAGRGLRAAGGGDRQAQQPVRRRPSGRTVERGVRQGARDRSAERVRRRLLLQPPGRPGARREAARDVRRARVRAGLRGRCARDPRAEAERARARRTRSAAGPRSTSTTCKRVRGGLLVQDRDTGPRAARGDERSHRAQADRGRSGASCCSRMRVCKHVRSNAIVLARELGTVGIGAGQMSRVDSVRIAIDKARAAGLPLEGAVDGLGRLLPVRRRAPARDRRGRAARSSSPAARSATPRSSTPCDAAGVAMVFTARRHFRH